MDMSYQIDEKVLLVTAHVHAALQIIPRLIGQKKDWAPWMRDNLKLEESQLSEACTSSPHPRLLGSLNAMLGRHYRSGMTIDTLRFDAVRLDDLSITDPSYVDIPMDALPQLEGTDFWWRFLPPSVSLMVTPPSILPSQPGEMSSKVTDTKPSGLKPKLSGSRPVPGQDSEERTYGQTAATGIKTVQSLSSRKRPLKPVDGPPVKPKKVKFKDLVDFKNEEHQFQIGPPPSKGKAEEPAASGAKICGACKTRCSECVWTAGPPKQKQVCDACVSERTRCKVERLPSILRHREKVAVSENPWDDYSVMTVTQILAKLDERVAYMEKQRVAIRIRDQELKLRVSDLEQEVLRLKGYGSNP